MSEEYELMHTVQQVWNEWSFKCLEMLGNVCLKYHISLCMKIFVINSTVNAFFYMIIQQFMKYNVTEYLI